MNKISYIGDSVISEFIFSFSFFATDDVHVALNGKILDKSKYSIIVNKDFNGGSIVFLNPPQIKETIDIFRQIKFNRIIDYQPTAKIDPEKLNTDFNFLLNIISDIRSIDGETPLILPNENPDDYGIL